MIPTPDAFVLPSWSPKGRPKRRSHDQKGNRNDVSPLVLDQEARR